MAIFFNGLPGASAEADAVLSDRIDDISSGTIMPPIQGLVQLKAKPSAQLVDKALIHVEDTLFTWRWDEQSTETPDDINAVKPDDITLPAPGRWEKHPTIVSSGGGSTMRDLAPDGYDYYILSDSSGDNTDVAAGLAAVLALGAGYYKVYIGPGAWTVNWNTSWAAGVGMTLHGAGKGVTELTMGGTAEFGQWNGGPSDIGTGIFDLAYITFRTLDWDGYLLMQNGRGDTVTDQRPFILPDGTPAPCAFHDCEVYMRTAGSEASQSFGYLGVTHIYNVGFYADHGTDNDEGLLFVERSRVTGCTFSAQDNHLLGCQEGGCAIWGCDFYTDEGDPDQACLFIKNSANQASIVTACNFYNSGGVAVRVNAFGNMVISDCRFQSTQANGVSVDSGSATLSRNVYTDAIDTA